MSKELKRPRRPAARPREVIEACMYERISMLAGNEEHVARLRELLDEWKRSGKNGKNADSGEGE